MALGSGNSHKFVPWMMEAVRTPGLAARFVTGYLHDAGAQAVRGGGATHA